jgi:hypothetical protein
VRESLVFRLLVRESFLELVFSGGGRRPPGSAYPSSLSGIGCFLFPWFVPVVFCSPQLVSGGDVCPPSCWGYGVWLFVFFVVVFLLFLTDSFCLKSPLGVTSVRVLPAFFSLRSMVLRRRSFDTTTQTLFAFSFCSCCLIHRRR